MATLYWRGGVDGDFSDVNNWVTAAGATPGAAPANNDTLYFDQGNVDVDAGLTTGLTGVTMIGTPEYTGRIAPGSLLSIALASLRWQGSGELNLTGNITTGRVRCRNGTGFNYGGGTATLLYIEYTPYTIQAAAVVTTLKAEMSNGSDLSNGTGYTLAEFEGGMHTTRRAGVFQVNGGASLTVKNTATLSSGTEVSGANSKIIYESGQTVSGTVTVRPRARFDATRSPSFTWSGTLVQWPNASVNLYTTGGEVTPSTYTLVGFGTGSALGSGDAIPLS